MVEVNGGADVKKLKKRVRALTGELDEIERKHAAAEDAFAQAVATLSGLAEQVVQPKTAKTLKTLKEKVGSKPLDDKGFIKAVGEFKRALILEQEDKAAPSPPQETKPQPQADSAGRHIAMALLAGIRVGDPNFDQRAEKYIREIADYIKKGRVRPAMIQVADLLDSFRDFLDNRRRQAENALREVLDELLKTEQEFAKIFLDANERFEKAGKNYDASLTASVGKLAQQVKTAKDLDSLRHSVLDHVRSLRESVKAKRAEESVILNQSKSEVEELRQRLDTAKKQMVQAEKESAKLSKEALTDSMTSIWNKRAFSRSLGKLMADSSQSPICLVVFDIDFFKKINDNYGHQAGDRALRAIAQQSQKSLRKNDTLYRYAGDEFCIIFVKTQLKEAVEVAERVRKSSQWHQVHLQGRGRAHGHLEPGRGSVPGRRHPGRSFRPGRRGAFGGQTPGAQPGECRDLIHAKVITRTETTLY